MKSPILTTKLHIPKTRQELVLRKRLLFKLDAGASKDLVLVSAPAGFGKTTLVSSWVSGHGKFAAWLSLDKDDNSVERFLLYLIAALQQTDREIGADALKLLEAGSRVPPEAILSSLINDLDAVPSERILVLDDLHLITSPDIHAAIAFLLEHLPKSFHLVIATRSDPHLPLAGLRAAGRMIELREADLRFTGNEVIQLLNDVMCFGLDKGSIQVLEKRTEGWIAGLHMAALSMQDRDDKKTFIEKFSGSNRFVMDYLMEQVLASQSVDVQYFLTVTAILGRFNAGLCQSLIDPPIISTSMENSTAHSLNVEEMITYLDHNNIFLVALDESRTFFRYHDLFSDMLQKQLHDRYPGIIRQLHLRAAAWLKDNGFILEAVRHFLAAEKFEDAADLIELYGPGSLENNDPAIIHMALSLPHEHLLNKPAICLQITWLMVSTGQIGMARELLNSLSEKFSNPQVPPDQRWVVTIISLFNAFLSPAAAVNGPALPGKAQLAHIPPGEKLMRNIADFLYAMTLGRLGKLEDAVEVSISSIRRTAREHTFPGTPTLAPFLSRIYLIQGHLSKTSALCREYLDPIAGSTSPFMYTSGSMNIDLGEVYFERGKLHEAEQHIREGLQANKFWKNIMTDGFGLTAFARVLQARGNHQQALETVTEFERRMHSAAHPREFEEDLLTLKVRILLASGDCDQALRWADEVHHRLDFKQNLPYYRLTLARIRLAQKAFSEVLELLDGHAPPIGSRSMLSREIESRVLSATAFFGLGQQSDAFKRLDACFIMAEPEGYLQVFLDVGNPFQAFLAAYLLEKNLTHKDFARGLSRSQSPDTTALPTASQNVLIDPLTDREIEVLSLIAEGMTNQSIAQQLFISPGTVKAHTSSIYRKLGVLNRTEAAARAREIGILS